jgi:hypothetical protein
VKHLKQSIDSHDENDIYKLEKQTFLRFLYIGIDALDLGKNTHLYISNISIKKLTFSSGVPPLCLVYLKYISQGIKTLSRRAPVRITFGELLRIFGSHCNPAPGSTSVGAT